LDKRDVIRLEKMQRARLAFPISLENRKLSSSVCNADEQCDTQRKDKRRDKKQG